MIKSAEFVTSARNFDDVRANTKDLMQVAFVGRSNVGKSSLINMLCGRKNLAVTSSTPGRTRLINFFHVIFRQPLQSQAHCKDDSRAGFYLVDLPGYGYAAAGKNTKGGWNDEIGGYLTQARNLRLVFVVLDIRHEPTDNDITALNFLQSNGIPFMIAASKADKLSRAEVSRAATKLAQNLGVGHSDIIITSAKDKTGRESILNTISGKLV